LSAPPQSITPSYVFSFYLFPINPTFTFLTLSKKSNQEFIKIKAIILVKKKEAILNGLTSLQRHSLLISRNKILVKDMS
jgi:hypothetical protein